MLLTCHEILKRFQKLETTFTENCHWNWAFVKHRLLHMGLVLLNGITCGKTIVKRNSWLWKTVWREQKWNRNFKDNRLSPLACIFYICNTYHCALFFFNCLALLVFDGAAAVGKKRRALHKFYDTSLLPSSPLKARHMIIGYVKPQLKRYIGISF